MNSLVIAEKPSVARDLYAEFAKSDGRVYTGRWFKGKENRFSDREADRALQAAVDGQPAVVREVEEIKGRLQIRSYDDSQGIRRKVAEVVTDKVKFLDRAKETA